MLLEKLKVKCWYRDALNATFTISPFQPLSHGTLPRTPLGLRHCCTLGVPRGRVKRTVVLLFDLGGLCFLRSLSPKKKSVKDEWRINTQISYIKKMHFKSLSFHYHHYYFYFISVCRWLQALWCDISNLHLLIIKLSAATASSVGLHTVLICRFLATIHRRKWCMSHL